MLRWNSIIWVQGIILDTELYVVAIQYCVLRVATKCSSSQRHCQYRPEEIGLFVLLSHEFYLRVPFSGFVSLSFINNMLCMPMKEAVVWRQQREQHKIAMLERPPCHCNFVHFKHFRKWCCLQRGFINVTLKCHSVSLFYWEVLVLYYFQANMVDYY